MSNSLDPGETQSYYMQRKVCIGGTMVAIGRIRVNKVYGIEGNPISKMY